MGAQNIVRVITEAGLAGEPVDLGANGILKIIPILDNTHTLQIGNGSADMSFKVFLGGADTYFLLNRATAAMTLQNVSFSLSDLTVDSAVVNTLDVNTTMNTGPLAVTGDLAVTGQISTNTLVITDSATFSGLVVNGTLTVNTALNAQAVTANTLTVDTLLNTGPLTVTGDLSATGEVSANTLQVTDNSTFNGLTVNGTLTVNTTLTAQDITANVVTINTTFTPAEINTNIVVANTLNTINAVVTGAFSGNTVTATTLNATALNVIPSVDDTGSTNFGTDTKAADLKIFLGGAAMFALFDRGNARLQLSGVELNTNAAIVSTGDATFSTVNATTVNTGDLNIGGTANLAANTFTKVKFLDVTDNTTINASHYGAFLHSSGSGERTLALPSPTNKLGVWLDVVSATTSNTIIAGGTDELAIAGDAAVNTIKLNAFGESVRITNINTHWVVSPYEGTTITTT